MKLRRRLLVALQIVTVLGLVLSVAIMLRPRESLASSDFSYKVLVNYLVSSDGITRVEETYTVTNHTANKYLDSIQLSTPTDETKNLVAEYSDGANIPVTTEKKNTTLDGYSYDYNQVNVDFDRRSVGAGVSWTFVVSYDTSKLVETKGGAHTVYIPAIAAENNDSFSVELTVPQSFGQLHTFGPQPTTLGSSKGQNRYRFDRKDLTDKSLALLFGDSTVYEINYNFPLQNTGNFPATFTIALPPNTSGQKIIVESLEPAPKSTRLDADGNVLADYDVPARTNITVKTKVEAVVRYLEYDLRASGTTADIPKDLVAKYTGAQRYWPADNPAIQKKAKELVRGKNTVADQVKAINDYVVSTLDYNNEKIKYNIRQGGLRALENPNNAVCLEYSDLSISLLRAAGIPARMPIGYGYSGNLKQSDAVADSLHSWVQAYVPNIGWMNVDPTWNEKFKNFGVSDLDHFAFAIWGSSDDSPAAVTAGGRDVNYQYEKAEISYHAVSSDIKLDGSLQASQYSILPFVALARYSITAPTSTAGDNYFLRVRHGSQVDEIDLGSLAPQQKLTRFMPVFGTAALNAASIDFTQKGENSLILASTKISNIQWPMWLAIAILAGIFVLQLLKFRATKKKRRRLEWEKMPVTMVDSKSNSLSTGTTKARITKTSNEPPKKS